MSIHHASVSSHDCHEWFPYKAFLIKPKWYLGKYLATLYEDVNVVKLDQSSFYPTQPQAPPHH